MKMEDNNIKTKNVDITPDASLLPKLGNSGYRLGEALAEFIDNSLDAKPSEQKSVRIEIELSENRVAITDNASGMNENEAINSLKLAYSDKKDKLGEYGLGLKTAATSLGKKFKLETSRGGDKTSYVLEYDEEKWRETSDWKSQELKILPKENPQEHGTKIIIQNLKFKYYPNLVTNTKRELSFRFAPYLENKMLEIKVNASLLDAAEPDLMSEKNRINIIIDKDKFITGWYGFLKKRHAMRYGFNLYKHGRLIRAEEKFGFEPHAEVALLYGSINLDFIPTTHNKREFISTSFEYKIAEEKFREYLKDNKIAVRARELSKLKTEQKKKERVEEDVKRFMDSVLNLLKDKKKKGEIEKEFVSPEIKEKEEIEKAKLLYHDKEFNLKNIEEGNTYDLKISGKTFSFKFEFVNSGNEKEMLQYFRENNHITILINIDFPFYEYIVKDYELYALFLISEVLSNIILKEMNYSADKLIPIRNLMFRGYGEVQKEIFEIEKIDEEKRRLLERMKKLEEKEISLKK